ncbi:MAG: hypothetical protein K6G15_08325 [Desulfovibrio sp.]|nr:hypothetical protein [Desulfovibrio sp.]
MSKISCLQRPLLSILLVSLVLLSVTIAGAGLWLVTHQSFLKQQVILGLEASLGQKTQVGNVAIVFTPRPVVMFRNLESSGPLADFFIPQAVFAPSLPDLLLARLSPAHLQFSSPRITLKTLAFSSSQDATASLSLPKGCSLVIENGIFSLAESERTVTAEGIDCYVKIRSANELQGDLFVRKMQFAMANHSVSLEDVLFLGHISPFDFDRSDSRFDLKATLRGPSWLHSMGIQATIGKKNGLWQCSSDIRGMFLQDEYPLPFSYKGLTRLSKDHQSLEFESTAISLGHRDSGTFNGRYDSFAQSLDGHLHLHHVSLTEWLGFARDLPAGLMRSLDHVTNAELDFHLDAKGLSVPKVSATCAGSEFSGKGGVADWRKPVVFLDMQAAFVDLIRGIPEAGAILPDSPVYGHEALTPEGSAEASTVGYDIRLGAKSVAYGPLRIDNAKVNIHPEGTKAYFQAIEPAPSTQAAGKKKLSKDILVDARAGFYEGQFMGCLALGGEQDVRYAIKASFSDVNGQKVGRALSVIPVRKGKWQAQAQVSSQGKTLETFLQQLRGSVRVDCRHGELHTPGSTKNLAFSALHGKLEPLRQGQWKNQKLFLDGLWKIDLERNALAVNMQHAGKIGFGVTSDGSGVEFQNLESKFSVTQGQEKEASFWGHSRLFWLPDKSLLRAQDSQLHCPAGRFSGLAELSLAREGLLTGKGDFAVSDLRQLIALVSQNAPDLPSWLRKVKGQASFEARTNSLRLTNLACQTDLGPVHGSFGLDWSKKFTLLPELVLERFEPDQFLPSSGKHPGKSDRLNYQGIERLRILGSLLIKDLVYKSVHFSSVRLPIDLADGILHLPGISGLLYHGRLLGQATLVFSHKSIEMQSNGELLGVSLATLAQDKMKNAQMTGTANLKGKMRAAFTALSDWPSCLWGEWRFQAKDGSYQALKSNGRANGKPTSFSQLSATGKINQGVLESRDVQLLGDGLKLTGNGDLNLNKLTIDCTFEVDKKGMPIFPIYIEGTLDKTKTSIGAGQLILNALGGMFGGLIGIFR